MFIARMTSEHCLRGHIMIMQQATIDHLVKKGKNPCQCYRVSGEQTGMYGNGPFVICNPMSFDVLVMTTNRLLIYMSSSMSACQRPPTHGKCHDEGVS